MNNKTIIIKSLNDAVGQFNDLILNLDENEFEANVNHKWSAGQDLVHLIKVLGIVNIGFTLPKFSLRLLYGMNKAAPRSFEQLQMMYQNGLAGGAKAPSIYVPKAVLFKDKHALIGKHQVSNEKFIHKMNTHTDFDLDHYLLPHPILGKVSLRELALFTSFHTIHHFELLKSKLTQIPK